MAAGTAQARLPPALPRAAVSGPGGGRAAGHPATRIGAGLAFEFRLGAEVMMVMCISICYCLLGKLCLDPLFLRGVGAPRQRLSPTFGFGIRGFLHVYVVTSLYFPLVQSLWCILIR